MNCLILSRTCSPPADFCERFSIGWMAPSYSAHPPAGAGGGRAVLVSPFPRAGRTPPLANEYTGPCRVFGPGDAQRPDFRTAERMDGRPATPASAAVQTAPVA